MIWTGWGLFGERLAGFRFSPDRYSFAKRLLIRFELVSLDRFLVGMPAPMIIRGDMDMKPYWIVLVVALSGFVIGCTSPSQKVKDLSLGMTPEDVKDEIGDPYTVRAAKVYEDGQSTEIWEYRTSFGFGPQAYWVYFENGRVVQWGQPGDFAGKAGDKVPVDEYKAFKKAN